MKASAVSIRDVEEVFRKVKGFPLRIEESKRKEDTVNKRRSMWGAVGLLMLFVSFFLYPGSVTNAEELTRYTTTMSCGDTKIEAVTTCVAGSTDVWDCNEQHFEFRNPSTGAPVRVKTSGATAMRDIGGGKTALRLDAVASDWKCVRGKAGFYLGVG